MGLRLTAQICYGIGPNTDKSDFIVDNLKVIYEVGILRIDKT